jgi:hypothetical protein
VSLPDTKLPTSRVPAWQRFAGLTLRTVFIIALAVLTFRVALPQNETIETAYDTPNDLIRLALGLALCGWLVVQLFRVPHDDASYRTWLYLGLAGVPFALICLAYVW